MVSLSEMDLSLRYANNVSLKSEGVLEIAVNYAATTTNSVYGIIWKITDSLTNKEFFVPQVCCCPPGCLVFTWVFTYILPVQYIYAYCV